MSEVPVEIKFSEVSPPSEDEKQYFVSLGRFVNLFAKVEYVLQLLLWKYTGVKSSVGKAVFAGAHSDVIRGYLKRLSDVGVIDEKEWSNLSPCLDQLRQITARRNDILHHGVTEIEPGQRIASNFLTAISLIRVYEVTPDILDRMSDDITKICIVILGRYVKPSDFRIDHESLTEIERFVWRYTPSLLEIKHRLQDEEDHT